MQKEIDYIVDKEFQTLIPPLTQEEYTALEESIINEGCRDPLVIWDKIILDGHNRYSICTKQGIIFKKVEKNLDNREQAKIWILENQLGRRNLNEAQRIDVVDKLFGLKESEDAKRREEKKLTDRDQGGKFATQVDKGKSRDKLGKKAKVSGRTYQKGIKIKENDLDLWNQCLDGKLSIDKASKEIDTKLKEESRINKSNEGKNLDVKKIGITFKQGDFTKILEDIPNESVDLILTDPPYPIKFINEWSKLADFSFRKLKKNGFLVAYCGHKNLYESMQRLSSLLKFYWIFSLYHTGNTKLIKFNNIAAGWKPILIYQKGFKKIDKRTSDVIEGTGRNKINHDWEQSLGELDVLIKSFSNEGDIVVDPFAGSGTTLVASKKLNRVSIGAEKDKDVYNLAKKRMSDALNGI